MCVCSWWLCSPVRAVEFLVRLMYLSSCCYQWKTLCSSFSYALIPICSLTSLSEIDLTIFMFLRCAQLLWYIVWEAIRTKQSAVWSSARILCLCLGCPWFWIGRISLTCEVSFPCWMNACFMFRDSVWAFCLVYLPVSEWCLQKLGLWTQLINRCAPCHSEHL